MNFSPIWPLWAMVALAAVLLGVRLYTLYRVLVRTATGRYRPVVGRWLGLSLAVLLILLAATRPALPADRSQDQLPPPPQTAQNLNVFFVVDRSPNQRVEDFAQGKSRMAGARADMLALIKTYPQARFALIGFSSGAHMDWPLSDDVWSLPPVIEGLSPYTSISADALAKVNAGAAADLVAQKMEQATRDYPDSKNVVFYLGSGAPGSRAEQGSFAAAKALIAGGAVLGYGSTTGGPVPQGINNGRTVFMADQQDGAPLNSALNEAELRSVADQLGVPYFSRAAGQPITPILPVIDPGTPAANPAATGSTTPERNEVYWLFTGAAAVLLLAEMYLSVRDIRRSRTARQDVTRQNVTRQDVSL